MEETWGEMVATSVLLLIRDVILSGLVLRFDVSSGIGSSTVFFTRRICRHVLLAPMIYTTTAFFGPHSASFPHRLTFPTFFVSSRVFVLCTFSGLGQRRWVKGEITISAAATTCFIAMVSCFFSLVFRLHFHLRATWQSGAGTFHVFFCSFCGIHGTALHCIIERAWRRRAGKRT